MDLLDVVWAHEMRPPHLSALDRDVVHPTRLSVGCGHRPPLTDREIIERLTRIETRLDGVNEGLSALRADMDKQNQQLNNRLGDLLWLFIGVMSFIGVIIAALIGVIIRERKTPPPLPPDAGESLEDVRQHQAAIRNALRALAQRNEDVAAVVKQFNL